MQVAPAVGIDLGTTNSTIAIWKDGKIEVVLNSSNETTTPSIVSFGSLGYSVGSGGMDIGEVPTFSEIFNAKRFLGVDFKEAISLSEFTPFAIVNDGQNRPKYQVNFKGKKHSFYPEQISALILRKMKKDAEARLGQMIEKAVITVPAYFNDAQKQSTKVAAELAGLKIIKIVSEPVAATLSFGQSACIKKDRNILVYDLGGGTFDVAIVNIDAQGMYETLATNGNTSLGGIDFDNSLYGFCVDDLKKDFYDITTQSTDVMKSLYEQCEIAKKTLSSEEEARVTLDGHEVLITRGIYESLISDQVNDTIKYVNSAIKDAEIEASDIDEIVLVGGSTLTPLIRSTLITNFGNKLNTSVKPHEAVAMGAAILAASLEKRDDLAPFMVRNVTPLSIGLLCKDQIGGKIVRTVVKRNTVYPNEIKCHGKTVIDNQDKLYFAIYEGESDHPANNRKLGSMTLEGIGIAPAGISKVDIAFKIDSNAELTVKAIDPKTKATAIIEIQRANTFTKDELEEMTNELNSMDLNERSKRDCNEGIDKDSSTSEKAKEHLSGYGVKDIPRRSIYGEQSKMEFEKELHLMEDE